MTTGATSTWQRFWYTRWQDLLRGHVDGSLNWRQLVAEQDLPANVRSLIEQVTHRTRLWRREKVDVARELIAHFQDGLDAGQSAEQLISSFGDPQQAATLIRRAKRRGRPLHWQIWHWIWVAFCVVLIAYVALVAYYFAGRPTIKVNYLAALNERAETVPEEARAWPLYRQGLSGLLVDRQWPEWMNDAELSPQTNAWPTAVAWMKEHEAALGRLREATERRQLGFAVGTSPKAFSPADQRLFFDPADPRLASNFPKKDQIEDQMLISTHLPHLELLKNAARLLSFDATRAALAGDADTALADVGAMLGIAEHAQQTPCLVATITASRLQSMAYMTVNDLLSRRPDLWSAGQLRDLAHAIAAAAVDWRSGFEGERAMFDDTMQRFYTDNGRGDGHLAFRGPEGLNVFDALSRFAGGDPHNPFVYDSLAAALMPAANLVVASRKETRDTYDTLLSDAMLRMDTPLWKLPQGRSYDPEFLAEHGSRLKRARHLFVSLMLPHYDKVRNQLAQRDGIRDGTLIGIALELYHRERNAWPESLDELSPRWLPNVPVDQITGQPLGYRIVDDRPVVYSVGTDLDDDGGRLPWPGASPESSDDNGPLSLPVLSESDSLMAAPGTLSKPPDGVWVIWSVAPKN